ncbi:hypothetical protein [Bradyrhizobium sp. S3.2.12]|uniref:hypothetical protein n=1 Tax=Bradyrhizobium sp. S3.2.12 TaxID=3156387 RepID=UPI003395D771
MLNIRIPVAMAEALVEARDILIKRGSTPRVNRNVLVFSAAEARQLDNVKDAVRSALARGEIVRDTNRLKVTQSDSALAKAKLTEANETVKTGLKEAWCYLHYPAQESAQTDKEWVSGKIPGRMGFWREPARSSWRKRVTYGAGADAPRS